MAETLKTLGQLAPAANTLTTLYTVPASTSVSSSSIVVCNRVAADDTFRIAVAVGGAADEVKQYLAFDSEVTQDVPRVFTIGITLAATDVVRVFAGTSNLSFNMFGVELT